MFVALGITGCIGAYKAPELVRRFQKKGLDVQAVATRHALRFVTRTTLETLTRRPLVADLFRREGSWEVEHISLARRADVLCVAPATANILAKFARGIADDFLSTLYLGTLAPVVVAPAMNYAMWQHPATAENVEILRQRGVVVVEPDSGYLACGETGSGRLADLGTIVETVLSAITPRSLADRKILVTSGPTAEDLDPVRFLTNRSTGRMGHALARIAARRGAEVILVSGPGTEKVDFPCILESVRSAAQMAEAVERHWPTCHAAIMSAAVADYTPAEVRPSKIKKGAEGGRSLELVRTQDILSTCGASRQTGQVLVGFAAETEDVLENARGKLERKGAHLIVANAVGPDRGFGTESNTVTILGRGGIVARMEDEPKEVIAARVLDEVERLLKAGAPL